MTAPEVIIASSSSSLLPSNLQTRRRITRAACCRELIPLNPPSLIPLVEIMGRAADRMRSPLNGR